MREICSIQRSVFVLNKNSSYGDKFMSNDKYNKLVRDKIPQIIEADNKECETEIISGNEKFIMLQEKLQAEVNEFLEDKNLGETC